MERKDLDYLEHRMCWAHRVPSCICLFHEVLTPVLVLGTCISIRAAFPHLGTLDIWGPDHSLWWGAVLCNPFPSCETTDVSQCCQMSPRGPDCPQLRSTALGSSHRDPSTEPKITLLMRHVATNLSPPGLCCTPVLKEGADHIAGFLGLVIEL